MPCRAWFAQGNLTEQRVRPIEMSIRLFLIAFFLIPAARAVRGQCMGDWVVGFELPGVNDFVNATAVFDDGGDPAL